MRTRPDQAGRRWRTVKLPAEEVEMIAEEATARGWSVSAVLSYLIADRLTARADADALTQHDQLQSAQREELTETARRTTESLDERG